MRDYDVGKLVKVTSTFTDPDNADAIIDPTTVHVSVESPDGDVDTWDYDGDDLDFSESNRIWRSAVGVYHFNVDVDQAGVWFYRWHSTGVGQTADHDTFNVVTPRAYPPGTGS